MINVEVERQVNENATNLIRRFSKRVQGSGVLKRARNLRYRERPRSKPMRKKKTLNVLKKQQMRERMIKLGKFPEHSSHR